MRKHSYKPGDQVKVLRSRFVKRVGYPLIWPDLVEEVEADPRTLRAWRVLTDQPHPAQATSQLVLGAKERFPREFIRAICMERVRERNFGGQERALIYWPTAPEGQLSKYNENMPDCTGRLYKVQRVRRVQTGQRVAPTSGQYHGPDGSEYWSESGGLENRKTVVLLAFSSNQEISTDDVELVMKAPK